MRRFLAVFVFPGRCLKPVVRSGALVCSVALTFSLVAAADARARGAPITFNNHIAPIVFQNCSTCHRPGQSGPFNLLTYADVQKRATQIAEVTKKRYMPPWLPEPGHGEFVNA